MTNTAPNAASARIRNLDVSPYFVLPGLVTAMQAARPGLFDDCSDKWFESGSQTSSRQSTPPGITIFGDLEAMEGGSLQQCGKAASTLRT